MSQITDDDRARAKDVLQRWGLSARVDTMQTTNGGSRVLEDPALVEAILETGIFRRDVTWFCAGCGYPHTTLNAKASAILGSGQTCYSERHRGASYTGIVREARDELVFCGRVVLEAP